MATKKKPVGKAKPKARPKPTIAKKHQSYHPKARPKPGQGRSLQVDSKVALAGVKKSASVVDVQDMGREDLSNFLCSAIDEGLNMSEGPRLNACAVFPGLARIVEIAAVGAYSVYIHVEYPESTISRIAERDTMFLQRCFPAGVNFVKQPLEADIVAVVLFNPEDIITAGLQNTVETYTDVLRRIVTCLSKETTVDKTKPMDRTCAALIKAAIGKRGLVLMQVQNLLDIAETIARIGGEDCIKPQHVAEAIGCVTGVYEVVEVATVEA